MSVEDVEEKSVQTTVYDKGVEESSDSSDPGEETRSPHQLYKISAVYDLIARLLPTEGRDYGVKFQFGDNDHVSVRFEPYSQFGKVWCEYCDDVFRQIVAEQTKKS